jgi:CMP-N-acetylneuraminic acid synthetase
MPVSPPFGRVWTPSSKENESRSTMNMRSIAIIPARSGSKGIPRKNVRPIAGKPLVAWSIEAALAAQSVSRVIVSTDDEEIAGVAREWGAEVSFVHDNVSSC